MEYRHTPVLLAEVTQHLSPQPGSIIVDCTLGGAGHAKRLVDLIAPTGILVGIDQDDAALDAAAVTLRLGQQELPVKTILLKGNFGDLDDLLVEAKIPYVDGFLFDLGVSSPQIDVAERGFSFKAHAPLDMRMIEVNGELEQLTRGLEAAIRWLAPNGRIAVISYHSLEDRIVKRVFTENSRGCTCPPDLPVCVCENEPVLRIVTRKAIVPSVQEIEMNARARSAKLRVAQKT